MAGDEEWAAPVEIVDAEDSTAEIAGGRNVDWHTVLRTGAAIVGALSLLWIGRSMADEHRAQEQRTCRSEVQSAYHRYEQSAYRNVSFSGEPELPDDVVAELAAQARSCGGNDAWADALEYEAPQDPDDD